MTDESDTDRDILTVKQAAKILQFSYRTTLALIEDGSLAASKIGGRWRILSSDLVVMMTKSRQRHFHKY